MSAARLAASSVNGELYPESVSSLNVPWPTFALALQSTAVAEVNGFIEKELGLGGGKADSDPKYRKVTPPDGTGPDKVSDQEPIDVDDLPELENVQQQQRTTSMSADDRASRRISAP